MDLVEVDSFIRKFPPYNLLILVSISILFIGAGIFFGTFFNDISFDILRKYNIYNPE